jgi:hypothetical protein
VRAVHRPLAVVPGLRVAGSVVQVHDAGRHQAVVRRLQGGHGPHKPAGSSYPPHPIPGHHDSRTETREPAERVLPEDLPEDSLG